MPDEFRVATDQALASYKEELKNFYGDRVNQGLTTGIKLKSRNRLNIGEKNPEINKLLLNLCLFQGSEEFRGMSAKLEALSLDAIAVGRGPIIEELRADLEARGVPLLERLLVLMTKDEGVEVNYLDNSFIRAFPNRPL